MMTSAISSGSITLENISVPSRRLLTTSSQQPPSSRSPRGGCLRLRRSSLPKLPPLPHVFLDPCDCVHRQRGERVGVSERFELRSFRPNFDHLLERTGRPDQGTIVAVLAMVRVTQLF